MDLSSYGLLPEYDLARFKGRTLHIGSDVCAVHYDWIDSFRRAMRFAGYTQPVPTPKSWVFNQEIGLQDDEFFEVFLRGVEAGIIWGEGTPLPGSVAAMRALAEAGHHVHLITDRRLGPPGHGEKLTRAWFEQWEIPYTTLTIAKDKTSVLADLPLDVYIDDHPDNVIAMEKAGVPTWMPRYNYNRHLWDHSRAVYDFAEFAYTLLAL